MDDTVITDGEEYVFTPLSDDPDGEFMVMDASESVILTATDRVWMDGYAVDEDDCVWTDRAAAIARIHELNAT
ncbi:hypothetical protein [Nonomuraea sp. NPDC050202]|uniref:hypothetical protein n=1 Tax=Nonomuraea sp. NPDC050202 TaxID=3155035 RepID=UPI0033FFACF3